MNLKRSFAESNWPLGIFLLAVTAGCVVFLLGLRSCAKTEEMEQAKWTETHCNYKKIKDVGGCNRWGSCSVRFEDDSTGVDYMPLKGSYGKWCDYDKK